MISDETAVLYIGNETSDHVIKSEVPPIYNSIAYEIEDTVDYELAASGEKYFYHRMANPNRDGLAKAISYLENGEETLVCSSGMGAISTTILGTLKQGDHGIFNKDIYGETISVTKMLEGFGIEVSFCDFTNVEEVKKTVQANTKLFYTEVISNPHTKVVDLREIGKIAKEVDAIVAVDSTFTTPMVMKPLNYGADVVIHSLTKFFGGHSDVSGGSITTTKERIGQLTNTYYLLGAALDANSAWMFQRSVQTMNMRVKAQQENAILLADALEKNPLVKKVYHPSLESHEQHELAKELFTDGYGSMISFLVEDSREKVDAFIHRLELVKYLGTLGGIRTSFVHPLSAFRGTFSKQELEQMGLSEGLIRISVGAENSKDIINDIEQALEVFK